MFNLNESNLFFFSIVPTDMRVGVNSMCGKVRHSGCNPANGMVYVFVGKSRKVMKLLHWERGGYISSVVDMSKFNIMEPYQALPSLHIGIEGYGRISKRAAPEDVCVWRADEISKEELNAKYFSREIELALARRLSRLRDTRLEAEVKKIENTMFFRLPSILRIPFSLNIPGGSTCGENPNVRHRSREELLRELIDQGYNVIQYKL